MLSVQYGAEICKIAVQHVAANSMSDSATVTQKAVVLVGFFINKKRFCH